MEPWTVCNPSVSSQNFILFLS